MFRHVHLADAAALVSDPHYRDILLAMSYGMYPFGVHESADGKHLAFRRVATALENKDKQRRMTEAVQALGVLPSVLKYNANLDDPLKALHVHSGTLHVLWTCVQCFFLLLVALFHTHTRKRAGHWMPPPPHTARWCRICFSGRR